jgi:hypothetical protein
MIPARLARTIAIRIYAAAGRIWAGAGLEGYRDDMRVTFAALCDEAASRGTRRSRSCCATNCSTCSARGAVGASPVPVRLRCGRQPVTAGGPL